MKRLALSSEFYYIKASDLKRLTVKEKFETSLPADDCVYLKLHKDGTVTIYKGHEILDNAPDDAFVKTRVVYISYPAVISLLITLIKPIKRRFYLRSTESFKVRLKDILEAKLPRGERNAENAYQFNNKLKEKYTPNNGANVHFDGAGLSGTPSSLGLTRYQSDVVDVLGVEPDLLIIEFAVNDDGSEQATRAFEALIRNALLANKDTAVIALYSAATYGNTAQNKKPVAEFYGVPQINVLDLFNYGVGKGYFTKNPGEYYADNVHPTKSGHELQADAIMNLFAAVDASSDDAESAVPENWCKPKPLTNFTRIFDNDKNVKITKDNIVLYEKGPTLKISLPGDEPLELMRFRSSQEEYDNLVISDYGCTTINVIGTCDINSWRGISKDRKSVV